MDTEVVLDTIPDKECATFLAHPEETADKVQQCVSSDSIPTGPEVTSKMCLEETYHLLIKKTRSRHQIIWPPSRCTQPHVRSSTSSSGFK